jgi:hypothetical protein
MAPEAPWCRYRATNPGLPAADDGAARLARVLLRGLVFYWWSRASRYGIVGAASSDILPTAPVTLFEAQATCIPTRLDGG